VILWLVIFDMARICVRRLSGKAVARSSEAPYQPTRLDGVPLTDGLHGAAPAGH
jgi:carbon starvation protein